MRITFTSYANLQIATADGLKTYEFQVGETATVPEDIAAQFLASGVAEPAKAEKAVKPKGETATK